jgi:hypothetical protein
MLDYTLDSSTTTLDLCTREEGVLNSKQPI